MSLALSTAFTNTLIAILINLAGTVVIYSLLAFFLTRVHWRDRGVLAVIMTIIAANLFWIVPTMIRVYSSPANPEPSVSYPLFFGNWLASAFSVILLSQTAKRIPRQLEDLARLDGCGWFGTYWHVVLPLVRQFLGLIALLVLLATTVPFLMAPFRLGDSLPVFAYDPLSMLGLSAIASLPVIGIFLVTKRCLRHPAGDG